MIHHTETAAAAKGARWPKIGGIAFRTRYQSVRYLYPHHLGRGMRQSAEITTMFH